MTTTKAFCPSFAKEKPQGFYNYRGQFYAVPEKTIESAYLPRPGYREFLNSDDENTEDPVVD